MIKIINILLIMNMNSNQVNNNNGDYMNNIVSTTVYGLLVMMGISLQFISDKAMYTIFIMFAFLFMVNYLMRHTKYHKFFDYVFPITFTILTMIFMFCITSCNLLLNTVYILFCSSVALVMYISNINYSTME